MAKRIIEISVNDEYVVGSGVVVGAEGADESVILRVAFGDAWAGLNIYATFRDSKGESPTVELLMPSMLVLGEAMKYDVVVPAAATAHAGKMSVVFSGFAVSEVSSYEIETGTEENIKLVYRDAVINTTNAYFRVLPSDFSALDVKDHTEATVLEKVLSEINVFRGELDEHEDDVASAIGEHEAEITATIGDLGTYKGENGEEVPYTVAGRLDAQDTIIDERLDKQDDSIEEGFAAQNEVLETFINDCNNGKYTVGIAAIEKKTPAQYTDPSAANYCVDTYLIRLTNGKEHSFTVKNGRPFTVARIYSSEEEMKAGCASDGVPLGGFVVIDTGNVEDEDNAKLYIKGSDGYSYITDLSGAEGIQGPRGDSYELTKDDKDEIVETIENEYFGDIDAALDAILAIQWQLMGAIAFTMSCYSHSANECIGTLTLYAEEGMTWGEWVNSSYNTIGAYMADLDYLAIDVNGVDYHSVLGNGGTLASNDVIIEDLEYVLYDW